MVNAEDTKKVNDTGATRGAIINLLSTVKEGCAPKEATVETVLTADGLTSGEAKVIIIDVEGTTVEGCETVKTYLNTAAKTFTIAEGSKVAKASIVEGTKINAISTPIVN